MGSEPQLLWDVGAELGEDPVWVERDSALWFVDIKRQKVHRFDPASGDRLSWDAPEQIGFLSFQIDQCIQIFFIYAE